MAGSRLDYTIGVDASDGVRGVKQFSRAVRDELSNVEDNFDDTGSAGKRAAAVLSAMADDVRGELEGASRASEALKSALGEVGDRADVGSIIADLKRMGLSFDEIEADAEELAAAIKKVDGVQLDAVNAGLGSAVGATDELSDSARGANSALANMIGNSAQDIGALGGLAGSAGVAIGQMAEYAADAALAGEGLGSAFKSMVTVAGPIAAMSAALGIVTATISVLQERSAESAKRVKELGEAMSTSADDAVGFSQVLRDNFKNLSDYIADANDPLGAFGTTVDEVGSKIPFIGKYFKEAGTDIFATAKAAGLSIYDLSKAIEDGGEVTGEFKKQLDAARQSGRISGDDYRAMEEALSRYGKSAREAAEAQDIANVSVDEANAVFQELTAKANPLTQFAGQWRVLINDMSNGSITTKRAADAINLLADELGLTQTEVIDLARSEVEAQRAAEGQGDAAETAAEKNKRLADEAQKVADAMNAQVDAALSAADAHLAMTEATDGFVEAVKHTLEVQKDRKASEEDVTDAIMGERDAAIDAAKKTVEYADAQSQAAGKALTATQRIDTLNSSLLDQAAYATPAARQSIMDYLIEVNNIPAEKATAIIAAVEAGNLDEAKRLLSEASATRTAAINADANTAQAERDLDNAANPGGRPRTATFFGKFINDVFAGTPFAHSEMGGYVPRGQWTVVGERGPELFVPTGSSGTIVPNHRLGDASSRPVSITINTAVIGDRFQVERAVISAMRRYERLNGAAR